MDWALTIAGFALLGGLMGLAYWQSHRPRKDSLRARWIPWNMVMLLSAAGMLLLLVHVFNLVGFRTGNQNQYRASEVERVLPKHAVNVQVLRQVGDVERLSG